MSFSNETYTIKTKGVKAVELKVVGEDRGAKGAFVGSIFSGTISGGNWVAISIGALVGSEIEDAVKEDKKNENVDTYPFDYTKKDKTYPNN